MRRGSFSFSFIRIGQLYKMTILFHFCECIEFITTHFLVPSPLPSPQISNFYFDIFLKKLNGYTKTNERIFGTSFFDSTNCLPEVCCPPGSPAFLRSTALQVLLQHMPVFFLLNAALVIPSRPGPSFPLILALSPH